MKAMYFGFEENCDGFRSYCLENGCDFYYDYNPEFSFVSQVDEILSEKPAAVAIDLAVEIDGRDDIYDGCFRLQNVGIPVILIASNPDSENRWIIDAFLGADSVVIHDAAPNSFESVLHFQKRPEEMQATVPDSPSPAPNPEDSAVLDETTEKPLSRKEIRKRRKEKKKQEKLANKTASAEPEEPKVPSLPRRIAVVGCRSRIGTTTAALQTAIFLKHTDPQSNILYIERNQTKFVDSVLEYVSGAKENKNGIVTCEGIDMISDPSMYSVGMKKQYTHIITDYGAATDADILSILEQDMVLNVCGVFPTELSYFDNIFQATKDHAGSFYLFNFVPEESKQWVLNNQMSSIDRTLFLSFAPDPFSLDGYNAAMFGDLSNRFEIIMQQGGRM